MSSAPPTAAPSRPPRPPLLRLVERLPLWPRELEVPGSIVVGERAYRLTRVHGCRRGDLLCCEAPVHAGFPDHATRRALRARLDHLDDAATVVFTDAARSAELWSWVDETPLGVRAHRERVIWPSHAAEGLLRMLAQRSARRAPPPLPDHLARELPLTLLRRAGRALPRLLPPDGPVARLVRANPARYGLRPDRLSGEGVAGTPLQLLRDLLEDSPDPVVVRAVWRATLGVRLLDPACGRGEWLLAGLAMLEEVYLGCLERMQLWLDETRLGRRPPRADFLRDFRAVLVRAQGATGGPRAFAAELALLWNLHGADPDPAAAARCRRRLLARAALGGGPRLPALACMVRVGVPGRGVGSRRALAALVDGDPSVSEALAERAEVAGRADRLLRAQRTEHGTPLEPLAAGLAAVRRRVEALNRELDRHARPPGSEDPGAPGRPLHLLAEWNAAVQRGGFHLVRATRP